MNQYFESEIQTQFERWRQDQGSDAASHDRRLTNDLASTGALLNDVVMLIREGLA